MREPCIRERDGGWFTSSYSGPGNTECVEAAFLPGRASVRDSKERRGAVLGFSDRAWVEFVAAVQGGELG